jgi:hypothetical protein
MMFQPCSRPHLRCKVTHSFFTHQIFHKLFIYFISFRAKTAIPHTDAGSIRLPVDKLPEHAAGRRLPGSAPHIFISNCTKLFYTDRSSYFNVYADEIFESLPLIVSHVARYVPSSSRQIS